MEYMTDLLENFRFEVEGKTVLFLSKYVNDLFSALCDLAEKAEQSNHLPMALSYDTVFFDNFLSTFTVDGMKIIHERQKHLGKGISFILFASSVIEKQLLTEDFLPLLKKEKMPFHFSCFHDYLFVKF